MMEQPISRVYEITKWAGLNERRPGFYVVCDDYVARRGKVAPIAADGSCGACKLPHRVVEVVSPSEKLVPESGTLTERRV
jgi:ribosomal protein L32